jgi:hypothetical protein
MQITQPLVPQHSALSSSGADSVFRTTASKRRLWHSYMLDELSPTTTDADTPHCHGNDALDDATMTCETDFGKFCSR